ncbi:MAG: transposase [Anaerolineae bacterium]|nr:MAG: transposase [Anaerolineae bacterium]
MRLLLQTCPNPYHLRDLGPAGIRQLFSDHGQRCGPVTANRIYAIAQQSLLPSADVCALLTAQAQADFLQYCWFEDQVAAYEARATALLPATFGQVLTTLPGVSPRMAARYLAGIGDPDRFTSARQIWPTPVSTLPRPTPATTATRAASRTEDPLPPCYALPNRSSYRPALPRLHPPVRAGAPAWPQQHPCHHPCRQ